MKYPQEMHNIFPWIKNGKFYLTSKTEGTYIIPQEEERMKIIISGGISDDKYYMQKFARAENRLRMIFPDATIFNPAEHCDYLINKGRIDIKQTPEAVWFDCMMECLPQFKDATHIYYIIDDYFIESDGVEIELFFAKKMGLERVVL